MMLAAFSTHSHMCTCTRTHSHHIPIHTYQYTRLHTHTVTHSHTPIIYRHLYVYTGIYWPYKINNFTYLLRTLRYNRVYIPFPGPPAENDPPPPIIIFRTQNATKSGSLCEQLSSPITKYASSGIGVGPRLTSDKSLVT